MKQIFIWIAIIVGICLVVAGMIYLVSIQKQAPTTANITIPKEIRHDDWVKGNRNASVIVTEYSDLQCPACAFFQPILKTLSTDFGDQLAIVYRHFPLPNHPHSQTMAEAAEAAGKQGKFFEMHDLIFENQRTWTNNRDVSEVLNEYADTLGLNIEQFNTDRNSEEIKVKVDAHLLESDRLGLSHTPTFFINGQEIATPNSYETFKALIEAELAKVNANN